MSPGTIKTVAFYTLGCKVNQSESQRMARQFEQLGYQVVEFEEQAQVYIINTCTVTQVADQKSRKLIRQVKKRNPQGLLVVTGCYAQSGAEILAAMSEVDLILPNQAKVELPKLVNKAVFEKLGLTVDDIEISPEESTKVSQEAEHHIKGLNRTRATLKIQDGCRQFCSYCIIPYVRGKWQSLSETEVVQQATELAAAGYREIVLLGIHLGAYGWDCGDKAGLSQVFEKLLRRLPEVRFRLGSLEPMEATPALLTVMQKYPNACKHLHLPLQAGQDRILQQMNRPYQTAEFRQKITEIRTLMPDIAITTDVMVGFPGEGEAEFQQGLDFVEEIGFARLHVFAYSQRPGTPAKEMAEQVSRQEKEKRSRRMIALGERLTSQYATGWFGREQVVLVEEAIAPGWWAGHTEHYFEVVFPSENSQIKGTLQTVIMNGQPGQKPDSWLADLAGY